MHISYLKKARFVQGHDIKLYNYNYWVAPNEADRLIERWQDQNECLEWVARSIEAQENEWCSLLSSDYLVTFADEIESNGGFVRSNEHFEYKRDLRGVKITNLELNTHMHAIHYTYFNHSVFESCSFSFSGQKDMFFFKNNLDNTHFKKCTFRNGWFFEGTMRDAVFWDCSFKDVVFNLNSMDKDNYKRIVFVNCNFEGCDLSRIDLRSCIFIGDCNYSNIKFDINDLNSFRPIGQEITSQVKVWDCEHWQKRKFIKSVSFSGEKEPIVNLLENGESQHKSKNNIMIRVLYKGLIDFYEFAADKYDTQKDRGLFSRTHYVLSWLVDEKLAINQRPQMFLKYFLSRFVAGYGDRPETSIVAWLVSVTIFSVLLGFSGIDMGKGAVTFFDQSSLLDTVSFAFTALYFSIITATTVGYGDIGPANGVSMFLSALNAIIGMFLFTTFTVVMVRRLFK